MGTHVAQPYGSAEGTGGAPSAIEEKLSALRRAVALWFWLDGLAVLSLATVSLAALSLAVDRVFRMDRPQRALCLVGAVVGLCVLAWRRLVRPLLRRATADALCLRVEAGHAELGERLISAVQFARLGNAGALGCSPALVRATIEAGVDAASGLDFARVLDARRRNRNALRLAAAAGLAALACVLFPGTLGLWFSRNVLLSDRAWPQNTHLSVVGARDGALVCPRGDDLAIQVEADPAGVVPSLVTLRFRAPSGSGSEAMVMVGRNAFRSVFRNVLEPFRFRASGGDATTPWHDVRLVERPVVERLRLSYVPPAYIGPAAVALPANMGPHVVPAGSALVVEGEASKNLGEATMSWGKVRGAPCERVGPRGFRTQVASAALASGAYAIALKDAEGLGSREPTVFSLRVAQDQAPVVRARLEGIGDLVVPRATIPISCRISDDYAVVRAEAVWAHHVESADEPAPQRLPIAAGSAMGARELATTYRLEAEPLKLPVGCILTFRVEATDNDAVTGPKVGASGIFSLRVVTEDELRVELLRREQEQRMEFERLLRDQQKLLENTRVLLASIKDGDTTALSDEGRRQLAGSEKMQRLVANRCIAIADRFAAILAEAENNKLDEGQTTIRERLHDRIIEPLRLLARRAVLEAADQLDVARRAATGAEKTPAAKGPGAVPEKAPATLPGRAALLAAAARQDEIVGVMRNILRNMVKWEGYQEAVNLLREVLGSQKQVNEATIREYKKRIEKIFDQ